MKPLPHGAMSLSTAARCLLTSAPEPFEGPFCSRKRSTTAAKGHPDETVTRRILRRKGEKKPESRQRAQHSSRAEPRGKEKAKALAHS